MRKICANVVPKVLSTDQKQMWVELCEDWLTVDAECEILKWVVTGNESWIYKYDPCNRRQSMEWKTQEERHMLKLKLKVFLIALVLGADWTDYKCNLLSRDYV